MSSSNSAINMSCAWWTSPSSALVGLERLINKLKFLLHLTLQYCAKYHVELSPGKTKLQLYIPPKFILSREYFVAATSLSIDGAPIELVTNTEHVGVICSTEGNLPHILQRFTSHNCAINSVLHTGLSQGHRANLAAYLRVEKIYSIPVLLSGTKLLVLHLLRYYVFCVFLRLNIFCSCY